MRGVDSLDMNTLRSGIGRGRSCAAWWIGRITSGALGTSGGAKITISAWRSAQAARMAIALLYASGPADAIMSTGFPVDAAAGREAASYARTVAGRAGTTRPLASQASAQRMAGPPALVMMPTRLPAGMG